MQHRADEGEQGGGGRRPGSASHVIREALRNARRSIVLACGLAVVHQLCEVAVPVLVGVSIDRAIAPGDARALAWSILGLATLFGIRAAAACLQWPVRARATLGAAQRVRMRVVDQALDPAGSSTSAGVRLSVASSDADAVGQAVTAAVLAVSGLAAVIFASILLVAMAATTGLVVVGVLPILLLVSRVAAIPLERRTAARQQEVASATDLVTDLCRGLRVLGGIDAGAAAAARYRLQSARARDATERSMRVLGVFEGVSESVFVVLAVGVVWVSGRAVVAGDLTIGEFVALVGLVTYIAGQTFRFTEALGHHAAARASASRAAALLHIAPPTGSTPTRAPGPDPDRRVGGGLELRAVSSGSLAALDLRVGPAEMVAVVCSSPADADALIDVLACHTTPTRGAYLIGGRDVSGLDVEWVRARVLVEPHAPVLFGSSVREAVRATACGDIAAALRASGADQVVGTLPGGADAPIGERGQALSGGQRQRVALARALAARPEVLVLRDPTTAVDSVTEARIASRLADVRSTRATVLVASSPALLAAAERVVLVVGGRVIAEGGHETLLEDQPLYRHAVSP